MTVLVASDGKGPDVTRMLVDHVRTGADAKGVPPAQLALAVAI